MNLTVIARFRKADGTLLGERVFIAQNDIAIPALVSSPNLLIRFAYLISPDPTLISKYTIRYRIAHILTFDPEFKESLVVKGLVLDSTSTDYNKPTNIRFDWSTNGTIGFSNTPKVVIQPSVVEVPKGSTQSATTESTLSFSLDGNKRRKDAIGIIIVDEWIVDVTQGVERLNKRYVFEHAILITDNVNTIADTGVGAGVTGATHIVVTEGTLTPILGDITTALQRVSTIFSNAIPTLNKMLDANILAITSMPVTTADSSKRIKTVFIVKESSPIAPLAAILIGIAGLAAITGIIYAIGNIMQIKKEEKELEAQVRLAESRVQLSERAIASTSQIADSIINNPNLSVSEKQALLDSLNKYSQSLISNIERSTSLLPSYLAGGIDINMIVLVGGIIGGLAIFAYIFGEIQKTRRAELLTTTTTAAGRAMI